MVLSKALLGEACPVETDVFCHFYGHKLLTHGAGASGCVGRGGLALAAGATAGGWFMATLEKKKRLCIYGLF